MKMLMLFNKEAYLQEDEGVSLVHQKTLLALPYHAAANAAMFASTVHVNANITQCTAYVQSFSNRPTLLQSWAGENVTDTRTDL